MNQFVNRTKDIQVVVADIFITNVVTVTGIGAITIADGVTRGVVAIGGRTLNWDTITINRLQYK